MKKTFDQMLEENRALDAQLDRLQNEANALIDAGVAVSGSVVQEQIEAIRSTRRAAVQVLPIYAVRG